MSQTTVQNSKAIIDGSGIIYVGETFDALVNVGAYRDLEINAKSETKEISFDNVPSIQKVKNFDKYGMAFKLAEIRPEIIELTNKGLVTMTEVAGTPVTGATQTIASGFTAKAFIALAGQNASGAAPTITTVIGSTTGALVAGTDYELVKGENGRWGIAIVSGITTAQTLTITYSYTPSASRKLSFASSGIRTAIVARFVHTHSNGKKWSLDLENVTNIVGASFNFPGDNEDDVTTIPLELEGYVKPDGYVDELTV